MLRDLARQLDDGHIYDRDLLTLSVALKAVFEAYRRRAFVRIQAAASPSWGDLGRPRG